MLGFQYINRKEVVCKCGVEHSALGIDQEIGNTLDISKRRKKLMFSILY